MTCTSRTHGQQPPPLATHRLLYDGKPAPGGDLCLPCAERLQAELSALRPVRWTWTTEPLPLDTVSTVP